MSRFLQAARERSNTVQTAHYLATQALFRIGLRRHQSGAVHHGWNAERTRAYVSEVFQDYLHYGTLSSADLVGRRVLEIGPGATLGVALLFAAHGAAEVVCVDRFESERDDALNRAVYAGIVASLQGEARRRAQACLDETGIIRRGTIRYNFGQPVEEIERVFDPASFDLIVSRAVLEHVYWPEQAWRSMDRVLRPGGRMLHKVDFRCHSFYEHRHPLHFLTVSDWLWRWLSAPDPTLNRARLSRYVELMRAHRHRDAIYITHLSDREQELKPHVVRQPSGFTASTSQLQMIERIRPMLAAPFREASVEDLIVNGAFIVAVKDSVA